MPPPPGPGAALAATLLVLGVSFTFGGAPGLRLLVQRATGRAPTWRGVEEVLADAFGPGPTFLVERVHRVLGAEVRARSESSGWHEAALLVAVTTTLAAALVWLRRRGGPRLLPDRADASRALDVLAWIVPAVVLGAVGLALGASRLDGGRALPGLVDALATPAFVDPVAGVAYAARMVLLAPLGEEVVWRGVVYPGLRSRLSVAPASALGALLFGLAHLFGGWVSPAPLAVQYGFALLAQHLVERRPTSLGAPLLLHAVGNLAAVLLQLAATRWPDELLAVLGAS